MEFTDNDILNQIFRRQTEINNLVFRSNGITDETGATLTLEMVAIEAWTKCVGVNELPNIWLRHYTKAMRAELEEVEKELLWKWWSKDSVDIDRVRMELVDVMNFLVDAMISAGLTPDSLYALYLEKHQINIDRQKQGYSRQQAAEQERAARELAGAGGSDPDMGYIPRRQSLKDEE